MICWFSRQYAVDSRQGTRNVPVRCLASGFDNECGCKIRLGSQRGGQRGLGRFNVAQHLVGKTQCRIEVGLCFARQLRPGELVNNLFCLAIAEEGLGQQGNCQLGGILEVKCPSQLEFRALRIASCEQRLAEKEACLAESSDSFAARS